MPSPTPKSASSEPESAASGEGDRGVAAFVDLSSFDNPEYDPGRGVVVRTLWHFCSVAVFEGGLFPLNGLKIRLLRLFGASIGRGVVVKPNVRIKYPWRLAIGDDCWIGQGVWIDNLADVSIGDDVCISQLVYLCTGSHNYRRRTFDLLTRPIRIDNGAWIGARCTLFQGVTVGANALVAGGSVVGKNVAPAAIVVGNPAQVIGRREPPPNEPL